MDIYRDTKCQVTCPRLFTDPEPTRHFFSPLFTNPEHFAKRRTIFLSVPKTVNIQGYSKLQEPIQVRKNCYPLIWQILNSNNPKILCRQLLQAKLIWFLILVYNECCCFESILPSFQPVNNTKQQKYKLLFKVPLRSR